MASPIMSLLLIFFFTATFVLLAPPSCTATDFVIYSNPPTALLPGQNFSYDLTPQGLPFGPASLHMQTDCNLVVYFKGDKTWASNTTGLGDNCYLTVDSHGEALLLRNLHYPVWRSGFRSPSAGSYTFLLQWNGGLAVYGPELWSSGNAGELSNPEVTDLTTDYVFYSYSVLPIGTILTYKNFKVVLRDDCNLVMTNTDTGDVKWQTNTYSPLHDCFVTLDDKGELFVKHNRRDILWRSGKGSESGLYVIVLRYDGTLAVFGSQIWTTKPFW